MWRTDSVCLPCAIPLSKPISKTVKSGFNVDSEGVQVEGRRGGGGGWEAWREPAVGIVCKTRANKVKSGRGR